MLARYISLAVFLLLVTAASVTGAGIEAGEWYHFIIQQPSWTPPDWMFPIAWTLIYILMALAAWKIWLTGHYSRLSVLIWWVLLLVLNVAWPVLFYGWQRPGWALPLLGLTLGIAVFCIRAFSLLSREAALLMTPYLVWVAYILAFDFAVWVNNGGGLQTIMG